MFMTNQQPAELTQPGIRSFDYPAALIPSQFASIFVAPEFVVVAVRHDQFNTTFLEPLTKRVRIIGPIGNHALGFLPRAALATRDADLVKRGFRKRNFIGRGTFQPNSQRNTFTVDQYHPLCAFATLGFADRRAPFFAGAKLPSRKASSHFSSPSRSKAPSKVRQAFSQTPCSSHCCSRRQQVDGEGNSSGRKRHAAPVCRIHKIPSKQARFAAEGRPRPSPRRFRWGSNGSINSHCSPVNSFCRFFMTEAHHSTCPTDKYLI